MHKKNYDNALALHYVYGQDTQCSREALKGILEAFLDLKIEKMDIQNPDFDFEKLKETNMRLYVVATLEDQTKDLIEVGVESMKDYEEVLSMNEWLFMFNYVGVKRVWMLSFLQYHEYAGQNMVKLSQWKNEKGEVAKEFERLRSITVEHKKLKVKPLEEMNAKERYMYYLKNVKKIGQDDLLDKILDSDKNVQALHKRLEEMGERLDKMHY